jgi:hypothetical protein
MVNTTQAISILVRTAFFPGYYKQKNKVLFIGREARWITSVKFTCGDYIATFLDWLENNNDHNQKGFTRRLLYIVQLIKSNGQIKFEELLTANDYAKKMVETGDYGFAVMNISKYSNDAKDGANADKELIKQSLEDTDLRKRNYFQKQLELLEPDIVITANLWDGKISKQYLDLCFGNLTRIATISGREHDRRSRADLYIMTIKQKTVKVVDVYHFASRKQPEKDYYYTPIKKLLFPKD